MIPQRSLSLISNVLHREMGGRRIPDQTIELDYVLGWFLSELATHPIAPRLAFKGGTALRRCHIGEYRFSEDLDFTLLDDADLASVTGAFADVAEAVKANSGLDVWFDKADPKQHQNGHNFYMAYRGPLGRDRSFKVDVTRTEAIVHQLETLPIIHTYEAFDFPRGRSLKTYSLDEIVTEKLLALTDPKRTQPRDLYDVWFLVEQKKVDLGTLTDGIAQKLRFRGRSFDDLQAGFEKKEPSLKKLWKTRLDAQMAETPPFEKVFREVKREIRQSEVLEAVAALSDGPK